MKITLEEHPKCMDCGKEYDYDGSLCCRECDLEDDTEYAIWQEEQDQIGDIIRANLQEGFENYYYFKGGGFVLKPKSKVKKLLMFFKKVINDNIMYKSKLKLSSMKLKKADKRIKRIINKRRLE